MPDTTIKKVEADYSPKGEMGQRYLVAGKRVSPSSTMHGTSPLRVAHALKLITTVRREPQSEKQSKHIDGADREYNASKPDPENINHAVYNIVRLVCPIGSLLNRDC